MQHYRKITTLAEDMAALGLGVDAGKPAAKGGSLAESGKAGKTNGKRLQESNAKRKERVKENRKRRLARRESSYKKRVESLVKLSESKNIAPRLNIRLKGALAKGSKMMESLDLSKIPAKSLRRSDMVKAFEHVSTIAGKLARKYAVVEELMDAAGLPVEHPESEYGLDVDKTNVRSDNKTGDATDYADGKSGAAGEVEEEDAWDDDKKKDDMQEAESDEDGEAKTEAESDDDMNEGEDDKTDMEECEGDEPKNEEDDEDKKAKDAKMEQARQRAASRLESMPMDFELNAVRLEAENMAAQIVGGTVGPVMAGSVLNDMVSYLGGALGLYQTLSADMEKAYIGQSGPDNDAGPEETENDNPEAYIGQKGPEGETAVDEGGIDASVPGKTDTAGGKSESKTKPAAKVPAAKPAAKKK